jgi:hypothetical protein
VLLFDAAGLKSGESPPDDSDKLDVLVLLLLPLMLFVADDFFDGLSLNSSLCLAILFGRCDVSIYFSTLHSRFNDLLFTPREFLDWFSK